MRPQFAVHINEAKNQKSFEMNRSGATNKIGHKDNSFDLVGGPFLSRTIISESMTAYKINFKKAERVLPNVIGKNY